MNKGDDNEPDSEQGLDWSVKRKRVMRKWMGFVNMIDSIQATVQTKKLLYSFEYPCQFLIRSSS